MNTTHRTIQAMLTHGSQTEKALARQLEKAYGKERQQIIYNNSHTWRHFESIAAEDDRKFDRR